MHLQRERSRQISGGYLTARVVVYRHFYRRLLLGLSCDIVVAPD